MRFRFYVIFVAVLLAIVALGTSAIAAGTPTIERTPIPMPPKPDFSAMKFLLGTWSCSIKSSRRPAAYTTITTNSIDPTGYWMVGKDTTQKMSWFPYETNGTDMTTYDADAHRWVDVYTGDQGGYGVTTSPGPKGNTIVWTDALFTPTKNTLAETPTIVTKVSNSKTTAYSTFKEGSGRTITVRTVCSKTS
jgi:hypothetical protein